MRLIMTSSKVSSFPIRGGQNRYKLMAQNLARSVYYWLCYVYNSSNSDVLLESSVRFPLVEYLERREGIVVSLEKKIDGYSHRAVDFYFEKTENYTDKSGKLSQKVIASFYIEIKFVSIDTGDASVRQKIYDDLNRLRHYAKDDVFCYFIMCGPTSYFETAFRKVSVKSERGSLRQNGEAKSKASKRTIYNDWFSFNIKKPDKLIHVHHKLHSSYSKRFDKAYLEGELRARDFSTTLIQLFPIDNPLDSYQSVGIWQVKEF